VISYTGPNNRQRRTKNRSVVADTTFEEKYTKFTSCFVEF